MLAYNIFHMFYLRNIKTKITMKELAELIKTEFHKSTGCLRGAMAALIL
jgi:hypothetical protein